MKFKKSGYNRILAGELYHFGFGFETSRRYTSRDIKQEESDFQYLMNKFSKD